MKNGIYFGLPEKEYRADPALSQSVLKDILRSPYQTWWDSDMNNIRPKKEEKSYLRAGTLAHQFLMQKEAFYAENIVDGKGGAIILNTSNEIKAHLADNGIKTKSNLKKPDLIALCKEHAPDAYILCELKREGIEYVKNEELLSLVLMEEVMRIHGALKWLQEEEGYSEVSIFWEDKEAGVQLKARLDRVLIPFTVDLKTFNNPGGHTIERCATNAIQRNGGHIQYVKYKSARENARELLENKNPDFGVYGEVDHDWLNRFIKSKNHGFVFLFQDQKPGHEVLDVTMCEYSSPKKGAHKNSYYTTAERAIGDAIEIYKDYSKTYGEEAWVRKEGGIVLQDEHVPYI